MKTACDGHLAYIKMAPLISIRNGFANGPAHSHFYAAW
eukprot:COSAG05_NODE_8450_length_702_cov_1.270315_1_plen_37_part_10